MDQSGPNVDSVIAPGGQRIPDGDRTAVDQWKHRFLILGLLYTLYVVWELLLLLVFPNPSESIQAFVFVGIVTSLLGLCTLLGLGFLALARVRKTDIPLDLRQGALLRLGLALVPGIAVSLFVPMWILREPPLRIDISPANPQELIAPLAVEFSLDRAVTVLQSRGESPVQYAWDFDGDGKPNKTTVVPRVQAVYDREGVYNVTVAVQLGDQSVRTIGRRLIIQQAIFSVLPSLPIIDQPVVLSVAHLLEDSNALKEVQWDLDGDGKAEKTTTAPGVTHTYYQVGTFAVTATILLQNQTQATYRRSISVREPPELPFPASLKTDPLRLWGAAPFGALFRIETEEPVSRILWNFGDGTTAEGERIAHTFEKQGAYTVVAEVRSLSGSIAELSTVVRVLEELQLSDLNFEGTPEVRGNRITGEVPLALHLKPITSAPFVEFFWEAPGATEVLSTEGTLQAEYRREGRYTLTLVGKNAQDLVLRLPIAIEVTGASSVIAIRLDPEGGVAPLDVTFSASETFIPGETISGFEWSFGDQSETIFGGAQVEHRFTQPGTYSVSLSVQTVSGKNLTAQKTIVVRASVFDACILPSRTSGSAPLGIEFSSDCSTGDIVEYLWSFGDGWESAEENPIHVFDTPGTYEITLTVTDTNGQIRKKSVTIAVQ